MNNKRAYCCYNAQFLTKNEFIEIGSVLIEHELKSLIKECNNGCVIDLGKITSGAVLDKINNIIKKKLLKLEYK